MASGLSRKKNRFSIENVLKIENVDLAENRPACHSLEKDVTQRGFRC
jgi:hypothetical protein